MKHPDRRIYWMKNVPAKRRAAKAPPSDLSEYDFDCGTDYMDMSGPDCWVCYDWQECTCPLLPEPVPLRVSLINAIRIGRERNQP